MKIVLVDNLLLQREEDSQQFVLQPHLGLISLIAVLQKKGYTAELYDPKIDIAKGDLAIDKDLYKNIAHKILCADPEMVGFTSLGCNFICTLKIARYIKEKKPALPILLGGPHATVLHEEIMAAYTEFDVIVRNEAEGKIIPVIEGILNDSLESIEGITYRKNGRVFNSPGASTINNLDLLPLPAYHAYPVKAQHLKSIRVEAGRGCPFACTFCSTATFFGRSYRLKSAENLCNELDFLHKEYGISDFGLTHDLFTVNKQKVIEFCIEVSKRKYTWRCSARMDCVDRELLSVMSNAGCRSIYYGIETGSARMQKISKKKLDLSNFHEILDITLELGMVPTLSFIAGYPEETQEDINDTLNLLGSCILKNTDIHMFLQLHLLTPEPGTALFTKYQDQLGFDDHISDFNFPTLEKDDGAIMENKPEIFMNHHYYKTLIPRHFFVITTSLFAALRNLGTTILRYLLADFDNSLAKLNSEVYQWAKENEIISMNNDFLLLFISRRFSYQSVLTSLARYQFEVNRLNIPDITDNEGNSKKYSFAPGSKVINREPEFRLIRNIHDCPVIITLLAANKNIPAKMRKEKHDFVIQLTGDKHHDRLIENYKLTGDAIDMLRPIEKRINSRTDELLLKLLN